MGLTGYKVADDIADIEGLEAELETKAEQVHEHTPTQITGLLDSNGKISLNYVPATAITDVYVVATQEQQNNLTVEKGDVVIRTDQSKSWIYDGSGFQQLLTPPNLVQSVNGKVGAVSLTFTDVGAAAADHTHTSFLYMATAQLQVGLLATFGEVITASGYASMYNVLIETQPTEGYTEIPAGHTVEVYADVAKCIEGPDQWNNIYVKSGSFSTSSYTNSSGVSEYIKVEVQGEISDAHGIYVETVWTDDLYNAYAYGSFYQSAYTWESVVFAPPKETLNGGVAQSPFFSGNVAFNGFSTFNGPVTFYNNVIVSSDYGGSGTIEANNCVIGNATISYLGATSIGGHNVTGNIVMGQACHLNTNTTYGTKIGTTTTQKVGFHGATPTNQRAGAAQAAVPATPTVQQLATLVNELRAALVEKGLIKGNA